MPHLTGAAQTVRLNARALADCQRIRNDARLRVGYMLNAASTYSAAASGRRPR